MCNTIIILQEDVVLLRDHSLCIAGKSFLHIYSAANVMIAIIQFEDIDVEQNSIWKYINSYKSKRRTLSAFCLLNSITSVGKSTTDKQPTVAEAMAGKSGENGITLELFCVWFESDWAFQSMKDNALPCYLSIDISCTTAGAEMRSAFVCDS